LLTTKSIQILTNWPSSLWPSLPLPNKTPSPSNANLLVTSKEAPARICDDSAQLAACKVPSHPAKCFTDKQTHIQKSLSGLDEQVNHQGSQDKWCGHQLGKTIRYSRTGITKYGQYFKQQEGWNKTRLSPGFYHRKWSWHPGTNLIKHCLDCLHFKDWLPAKTWDWWEANHWSVPQ